VKCGGIRPAIVGGMTKTEIIARAHAAEAKLANIAKTRRPTAAETAEALTAYEAAAKVSR
jgi:hypothetical protein